MVLFITRLPKYFFILSILMSFLFCNKQNNNEQKLNGSVFIKKIQSLDSEIPNNCDTFSEKINIPSSISGNKNLMDGEIFEYCIPFKSEIKFSNDSKAGLSLGYIDNLPMVYLNGKLIYSYNPNSKDHIFYYEKELFFEIDSNIINKNNILIVRIVPIFKRENGMGMYGGNIRLSNINNLVQWNTAYKMYNFGKVVLYFGTSLLYLTLFLGRKKEKSFLLFGIFLFIVGIYFSSKLEIKFDIGINLLQIKKIEYLSLVFLLPSLNLFLLSILQKSLLHWITAYSTFVVLIFSLVFIFIKDLKTIDEINHIYHVPFILLSLSFSILVVLNDIRAKNARAFPIFVILIIPFILSIFNILNSAFLIFPLVMNFTLGGDSIFILVVSMTIYVARGFYKLQSNLDLTIKKEESLRKTFQLYVPPKDLEKILKSYDNKSGLSEIGEVQKTIILFCDIREFTTLSEKMTPNEVVSFLNSYFSLFNSIIIEKGGVIDKLIGDCIMARFDDNLEKEAIETALLLQAHIKRFNSDRKKNRQKPISHGVGVSMGEVVVGNIGSVNKMDYTVIGDAVNLASRLESLTKYYGVDIIVTENLYRSTKHFFYYREIDKIRVKGKKKTTRIYQPISPK
jgi:adenylate cyclase